MANRKAAKAVLRTHRPAHAVGAVRDLGPAGRAHSSRPVALVLLPAQSMDADDLDEIRKALGQDQKAREESGPEPPSSGEAAPTGAGLTPSNELNAAMSLILDAALAWFSRDENNQRGGHDPTENGFNLQQLEMSAQAAVDPYFRFDTNIVFSLFGVEVEEAYGTTLSLPWNLQLRAGQFLTRYGRLNNTHPHSWDFVDQPMVHGKLFGSEGQRGLGIELSVLLPLPWYVEVVGATMGPAGGATAPRRLTVSTRWGSAWRGPSRCRVEGRGLSGRVQPS